jgi:VWFA-related protein
MHWLRVILAVSLLAAEFSPAQTAPANSNVIELDVAVTDKAGKPVPGLEQKNFTVLDDKHPANITSFKAVNVNAGVQGPPTEMVIVIDAINADVMKAERQREGIRDFLTSNQGKLPIPVSLITISDISVSQPSEPSLDGNAVAAVLDKSITGLRTVNRGTQFAESDRFDLSLKALNSIIQTEAPKPGKKLIVWVSPGWPLLARAQNNISGRDQQELFSAVVRFSTVMRLAHITLYNIVSLGVATDVSRFFYYTEFVNGVKSPGQTFPPNLALQVLATQTGGLVLNGSNDLPTAMAAEIARTTDDGRVFYILTFQGAEADKPNEYHTISVRVDQPGLVARTRTGYYAQPGPR